MHIVEVKIVKFSSQVCLSISCLLSEGLGRRFQDLNLCFWNKFYLYNFGGNWLNLMIVFTCEFLCRCLSDYLSSLSDLNLCILQMLPYRSSSSYVSNLCPRKEYLVISDFSSIYPFFIYLRFWVLTLT